MDTGPALEGPDWRLIVTDEKDGTARSRQASPEFPGHINLRPGRFGSFAHGTRKQQPRACGRSLAARRARLQSSPGGCGRPMTVSRKGGDQAALSFLADAVAQS